MQKNEEKFRGMQRNENYKRGAEKVTEYGKKSNLGQKRGRHGNLEYVQICCVILGLFVNVLSNLLDKEGRKSNSKKKYESEKNAR